MVDEPVLRSWGAFGQELRDDPYPLYARLREAAPVHRATTPDGRTVWLVTRYEDARSALADPRLAKDPRRFLARWGVPARGSRSGARSVDAQPSDAQPPATPRAPTHEPDAEQLGASRPGTQAAGGGNFLDSALTYHMLNADPPDHTRLRRLVSKAFTARRVESLQPLVHEITDMLLDAMAGLGQTDLIETFAFPLPITVICELLGVPLSDQARIRQLFTAMLTSGPTAEGRQRSLAAAGDIAGYVTSLIAAKRTEPADDMLSDLIAARDGAQRLDENELTSMAFLLVIAGHETTVNLIGNGLAALLSHPDQLAALRADPSLVPSAVEEFLRYDGPVEHATFRYTTEPVEVGGTTIPEGQMVLVVLAAADRDPARFAEPGTLDVRRGESAHLAFGHGIHFCLGAPLARMEGRIAFTSLLARFPDLRLAVDPADLHRQPGMILRGLRELPVALTPAAPAAG